VENNAQFKDTNKKRDEVNFKSIEESTIKSLLEEHRKYKIQEKSISISESKTNDKLKTTKQVNGTIEEYIKLEELLF
jgi:hypothetical protein